MKFILAGTLLAILANEWGTAAAAEPAARVLVVVGPSTHYPGSHEVGAGGRLIAWCAEHASNVPGISAEVSTGWPTDAAVRERASTVVFIGDTFPPARLPETDKIMGELGVMMNRGCGIVCVHYATGLRGEDVPADGDHELLRWMGGYFATGKSTHHKSIARIFDATIEPGETGHPVCRGWRSFTVNDEPYYNNYFGPNGVVEGVSTLATSLLPPEKPKREVVAWGIQRKDGGRGVGVVVPHFYKNWTNDDLRRLVMNAVVWTAGLDVPADGVVTPVPHLEAFDPESIEPKPRPKPAKAQ